MNGSTCKVLLHRDWPCCSLTSNMRAGFPIASSRARIINLLNSANLTGEKQFQRVILFCISLTKSKFEQFIICLKTLCLYFSGKHLSFARVSGFGTFISWFSNVLYVLGRYNQPFICDIYCIYFLQVCCLSFYFVMFWPCKSFIVFYKI